MTDTEQKSNETEEKSTEPEDRTVTSSNGIIISEPDQTQTWIANRNSLMLHGLVDMVGYTEEMKRNIKHIRNRSQLDQEYYTEIIDQIARNTNDRADPDLARRYRTMRAMIERIRIISWSRRP